MNDFYVEELSLTILFKVAALGSAPWTSTISLHNKCTFKSSIQSNIFCELVNKG